MSNTGISHESELVYFWNRVLAPKFIQFRHILVEGTSNHSAQVLPTLDLRGGEQVIDIGCGFGDTSIELARLVGPKGAVLDTPPPPRAFRCRQELGRHRTSGHSGRR